jgi:hypothetical protein
MNVPIIKPQPNEQILTGRWLVEDGHARGDTVCERIAWLIAHHLQKVVDSPESGAWETLFRAPDDGRYWELTYPQSGTLGGGPPQLKCVSTQEGTKKYGTAVFALR